MSSDASVFLECYECISHVCDVILNMWPWQRILETEVNPIKSRHQCSGTVLLVTLYCISVKILTLFWRSKKPQGCANFIMMIWRFKIQCNFYWSKGLHIWKSDVYYYWKSGIFYYYWKYGINKVVWELFLVIFHKLLNLRLFDTRQLLCKENSGLEYFCQTLCGENWGKISV